MNGFSYINLVVSSTFCFLNEMYFEIFFIIVIRFCIRSGAKLLFAAVFETFCTKSYTKCRVSSLNHFDWKYDLKTNCELSSQAYIGSKVTTEDVFYLENPFIVKAMLEHWAGCDQIPAERKRHIVTRQAGSPSLQLKWA